VVFILKKQVALYIYSKIRVQAVLA